MNGTFIYHNGQLQYSHKEFPKLLMYEIVDGNPVDFCSSQDLQDFYASLLPVVNHHVWLRKFLVVEEGDHWPVPDGVEIEEVETMSEGWQPTYNNPDNHNLEQPAEPIKAVRLSIKATI